MVCNNNNKFDLRVEFLVDKVYGTGTYLRDDGGVRYGKNIYGCVRRHCHFMVSLFA